MNNLLQGLAVAEPAAGEIASGDLSDFGWIILIILFAFMSLVLITYYIYVSIAFTSIGKKAKIKNPYLAWIPFFGPKIIAFRSSKMHWWPWLLVFGYFPFIISMSLTSFAGGIVTLIFIISFISFPICNIIWEWKMFERVRRPGWWSIVMLIPIIGLVVKLTLIGVAAWSKN